MAQDNNFQMPDMRAFTEQAKTAFETFVAAAQQAVNSAQTQALSAHSGVREMGDRGAQHREEHRRLLRFRAEADAGEDAKEIAELHAAYIKEQMQALADQAQEFGRQAMKLGVPAAKP
jgi:hypothetical protein